MSRRHSPTMADRHIESLLARHPRMRELPDGMCDANSPEAASFKFYVNKPTNLNTFYATPGEANQLYIQGYMVDLYDIELYSRWRQCRHVYHFDPNLSKALADTVLPDNMAVDVLNRLPYHVIYVSAPMTLQGPNGFELKLDGFFAYIGNYVRRKADYMPIGPERSLMMFPIVDGHPEWRLFSAYSLEVETFGEMVDDVLRGDAFNPNDDFQNEAQRNVARHEMNYDLNHLLYLISENCEQEVIYRPSGNSRRASKTSQSTIHAVGQRVGRALGQAKVHHKGSGGGVGTSPRTHVRCGHFHHYWVGPRSNPEKRRLTVRWIDPLVVNASKGDPAETVTHEAR